MPHLPENIDDNHWNDDDAYGYDKPCHFCRFRCPIFGILSL